MAPALPLLPTTIVGSYPQPDWLVDRSLLAKGVRWGVLSDLAGKSIVLGVIDLADPAVETAEQVAARIRAGLERVPAARLIAAPDCGMKYLPRDVAFGKLAALSAGARLVRAELTAEK